MSTSIDSIFSQFDLWNNLPNKDQYLAKISFSSDNRGQTWLDIDRTKFLTFVFGFVDYGYTMNGNSNLQAVWDDLIIFLNLPHNTIEDMEFNSPVMNDARHHYEKEIDTMVYKPKRGEGIYTCRRCKSTNIDTQALQLRSADEPVTVLARCDDCGLGWKDS